MCVSGWVGYAVKGSNVCVTGPLWLGPVDELFSALWTSHYSWPQDEQVSQEFHHHQTGAVWHMYRHMSDFLMLCGSGTENVHITAATTGFSTTLTFGHNRLQ